jgi:DNA-binding SARP family transcriptional activator/WD40 repeat protein
MARHPVSVQAYVSSVEVKVLGPVEVLDGDAEQALGGPKQRTVLALLAAALGRVVPTDALVEGLYGDDAGPGARRTVHTYVSNLRRVLGDVIIRSGDGYRLALGPEAVDWAAFEKAHRDARVLIEVDPVRAGSLLREALAMWRGHAYTDVESREMLNGEIIRLQELRLSALEARIDADLACGLHRDLIGELEALTAEHPLRETFRAQHMLALYRSGRQSEALRAFGRTRKTLGEELGIEPSHELQTLEQRILDQDPALDLRVRASIQRRAILAVELVDATISIADQDLAWRDATLNARAASAGGVIVDLRGTAAVVSFPSVASALETAKALSVEGMRIAIDHGEVEVGDDRLSGPPVNRSLRLAAVGNPGQVLLSSEANTALSGSGSGGWTVTSLGSFQVRGIDLPTSLFQLAGPDVPSTYGPLLLDRLPPPLLEGVRGTLAGYELREELGADRAGTLHRAYQPSVGREVAVRAFRSELVSDQRFIRRFEAVAQRLMALEHPNVVPIFDYWREPGRAVLVHRLLLGGHLGARFETLDEVQRKDVLRGVGGALAAAHEIGVFHGAVLLENVLFDRSENPYLADLGVATIAGGLVDGMSLPSLEQDTEAFSELVRILLGHEAQVEPGLGVAGIVAAVTGSRPTARTVARNPYKGLKAFREGDAGDFYGRESLVADLLESVAARRLTVVVGPSGIGKSSVVRAGLVPALRAGAIPGSARWLVTDMFPGAAPFDALEEALRRVAISRTTDHVEAVRLGKDGLSALAGRVLPDGAELVLIIDQFEEVFTHVSDEEVRRRLLDLIAQNARDDSSPVRVVATLRADFFDRPLRYADFGDVVADSIIPVAAPGPADLAAIVERPSKAVGVAVDPALVESMVSDAEQDPGALPLLEHALTELFDGRHVDLLTLESYRAGGGLAGTVGRRAEEIFEALNAEERVTARDVFLRLVTVDEAAQDTRRRVRRSELEALGDRVDQVLDAFGRHRLLVFDRDAITRGPTVEVAHEALLTRWDRFRDWLDEARDDLLVGRRLELAAGEWARAGSDPSFLMRGGRLEQAEVWHDTAGMPVGEVEASFLAESRIVVDRERLRLARIRRRVLVGLSAMLVLAVAFGSFAWFQRGVARQRTLETRVRELAREAGLAIDEDPNLAINLAIEAYELALGLSDGVPGEALSALQTTVQSSRMLAILPFGSVGTRWSTDGALLATVSDTAPSEVVILESDAFRPVSIFDAGGPVGSVAFIDAERVVVSHWDNLENGRPNAAAALPLATIYDATSGEELMTLGGECCAPSLSVSPNGRWLAVDVLLRSGENRTEVWSLGQETLAAEFPELWFGAWGAGADELVLIDDLGGKLVVTTIGSDSPPTEVANPLAAPNHVSVDPGSGLWAVTSQAARASVVIDPSDGRVVSRTNASGVFSAQFTPDGANIILYGNDNRLIVTSPTGEVVRSFRGVPGGAPHVDISPDGRRVAVTTFTLQTVLFSLASEGPDQLGSYPTHGFLRDFVFPEGDDILLASQAADGVASGVLRTTSTVLVERGGFRAVDWEWPIVSRSGLIAGLGADGVGLVVDVASGEIVVQLDDDCGYFPAAIDDTGRRVLLGGGAGCTNEATGRVLDLQTGAGLVEFDAPPLAGAFGPAGTPYEDLVVVNHDFTRIELIDTTDGSVVGSMVAPGNAFVPVFSHDGRYVSWGSQNGIATVVDVQAVLAGRSMDEANVFQPSVEGGPVHVVLVRDGLVATSHSSQMIRLWELDSGEAVMDLPVESDTVVNIRFSDDGRYLWYTDGQGELNRMPMDPEELVALARERSLRGFTADECQRFLINECAADEGTE